jgi:hypothetical protein
MKIRVVARTPAEGRIRFRPSVIFLFPPQATSICGLRKCSGLLGARRCTVCPHSHRREGAQTRGSTHAVRQFVLNSAARGGQRNWAARPTVSRRVYVKNLAKKCLVVGIVVFGFASAKINLAADGAVYASDAGASHTHGSVRSLGLTRSAFLLCRAPGASIAEARIRRAWRSKQVTGPCASSPICRAARFR